MQTALIGDLETAIRRHHVVPRDSASPLALDNDTRGQSLPVIVHPQESTATLAEWITSNRNELNARLLNHGGILFRDFAIESTEQFESAIESLSGRLLDYTYRSTPRTIVSGRIYTSTEYPPHQTIPLHNENSYTREWPMKIWFFSRVCAETGGETPIADSRKVYQRIPRELREKFQREGAMGTRRECKAERKNEVSNAHTARRLRAKHEV